MQLTTNLEAAEPSEQIKPARMSRRGLELIYRHTPTIRLTHWVNVFCIAILLMSGLQIFNAHPRLYWGNTGNEGDPAIFEIYGEDQLEGPPIGWTKIGNALVDTTGVLGVFMDVDGFLSGRAFPYWITLPSTQNLAEGRRWHFFFAWLFVINGLIYLSYGFVRRHFQRDIAPTGADFKRIGRTILDHLTFTRARGEEAKRYNVLQKLTYIAVIFVLLPLMILTGLSMSPGVNSAVPWLFEFFGGRQSARTLHFISASLIVLFVVVHVIEVIISGPINEMRSMISGWFALTPNWHVERYLIFSLIVFAILFASDALRGYSPPGILALGIASAIIGSFAAWFVNRLAAKRAARGKGGKP